MMRTRPLSYSTKMQWCGLGAEVQNPGMECVAQWVRTSSTKRSRGRAAATLRNAAPIAFRLPGGDPPLVHEVRMHEADDFNPHASTHVGRPGSHEVSLTERGGGLRVMINPSLLGMPRRHRRPPGVRRARGEWVRWQINYRFISYTGRQGWSYRLDTLNLANGPVDVDTFLGKPTYIVDERGRLA